MNSSWRDVSDHLDRLAPPIRLNSVVDRHEPSAQRNRGRRRWMPYIAALVLLVAASATAIQRSRTSSEQTVAVDTSGAKEPDASGSRSAVEGTRTTYRISPLAIPTASLVIGSSIWIASVDGSGSATMSIFPLGESDASASYPLPGEVPAGAIASSRDAVWVATINAEEAALVRLPVAPGTGAPVVVDRLERGASLAASDDELWVRSDRLLQQRDGSTGKVIAERSDLGIGWVATSGSGPWTTDRATSSLLKLSGVTTIGSLPLAPPADYIGDLAVNDAFVFATQGDGSLLAVNVETGRSDHVDMPTKPLEVEATPSGALVLGENSLTYYEQSTGRVVSKALDMPAARGLAIDAELRRVIICAATVRCIEVEIP